MSNHYHLFGLLELALVWGFPLWLIYWMVKGGIEYLIYFSSLTDDERAILSLTDQQIEYLIPLTAPAATPVETQDLRNRAKPEKKPGRHRRAWDSFCVSSSWLF